MPAGRSSGRILDQGSATQPLTLYPWPGNVKELKVCVSHVLKRAHDNRIEAEQLPAAVVNLLDNQPACSVQQRIGNLEHKILCIELRKHSGNISQTAKALGLSYRQVSWRIQKYRIRVSDYKPPSSA